MIKIWLDIAIAARDAAQRDSIIMSFAREQQAKMVRTALSSGSDESVKEGLFVYNTRRGGARGSEGLPSDANLIAPHPSPGVRHASGAPVLRDGGLACLSSLYWRLDGLASRTTIFSDFEYTRPAR